MRFGCRSSLVGFGILACLWGTLWASLEEVQPGDSAVRLEELAGKPQGSLQAGHRTVHTFAKGRVVVEDGVVKSIELKDPEAEIKRQERLIEREREAVARDEARVAKGHEVKELKLKDPSFRRLPAETRLNFWLQFNRYYPEVEIGAVLQSLYREMDREAEWKSVQVRTEQYPRYDRRYYYVPGYRVNYGGRERNRTDTGREQQKDSRSGIVEYDNATFFSPDMPGLPGGEIR